MSKKTDTIDTYEDMNDVFDNEFIELEFINELTEWRENNEQQSSYRSEGY